MLKTLKPEEFNVAVSVQPGAAKRISPKALTAALGRARLNVTAGRKRCATCGESFEPTSNRQQHCTDCTVLARRLRKREYMREYMRAQRRLLSALAHEEVAPRTSGHWHFKIASDGRPTCWLPTRKKPSGRYVRVPICGHESALEAMDRCVTGWGDKDSPSKKLQWRDE